MGVVSPAALPIPKTEPVIIPGSAVLGALVASISKLRFLRQELLADSNSK